MLLYEGPEVHMPCERENPFVDLESLTPAVQMPVIQSLDECIALGPQAILYIYIYIYRG